MCRLPSLDCALSPSCPARGGGPPQPRRVPTWLPGLAALAILAFGAASPQPAYAQGDDARMCSHPQAAHVGSLEVIVHADRISLRARDVPLCAVLSALAAETGLTVYGEIAADQLINAQFERQRITRVLDRLLGGGYLLVLPDATSAPHGQVRALTRSRAPLTSVDSPSTDEAAMPAAPNETVVDERRTRREAIESAVELDEAAAVSLLASALADPDADLREIAIESLAMLDSPNARELLHASIQDPDPDVRLEIIDTLSDLDDARSTAALERALADTDARVREAAAEYLAERN